MKTGTPDQGPFPPNDPVVTGSAELETSSLHHLNSPPPSVPDYELLRCIGRGSYGDVWLARNVLGQFRALKFIYRRRFADPRPFEREFEGIQRFEPISRSHPSQLHILHVGKNDAEGCFYYVMELADGVWESGGREQEAGSRRQGAGGRRQESGVGREIAGKSSSPRPEVESCPLTPVSCPLTPDSRPLTPDSYSPRTLRSDLERHGRLPPADCVQIGLSLATALGHLHEQGLVHRDIKPSNVIFVNGMAKLSDIGLVTDAGDTQSIVGTEGYLPPEGPGTPQADLYSLGKVLYEISTGMDRRCFAELPDDVWTWPDSKAVVEFNEIVLKACAKDVAGRCASASELSTELQMLERGQSVKRWRRHQRWSLRVKRTLVAGIAVGVLFAVTSMWPGFRQRELSPSAQERLASRRRSVNSEANVLAEQGYAIMKSDTPERLGRALSCFTNAIQLDPNFARAYAGLLQVYAYDRSMDHSERMASIAQRLLKLDDTLPESHYSLSYVQFSAWNFEAALKSVRHALALDPNCAFAHQLYGFYLTHLGFPVEGRRAYARGVELDPTNPRAVRHLGHPAYALRQFDEAQAQYQRALDLEPRHMLTHFWLGRCYQAKKDFLRAIDEFEAHSVGRGADPDQSKTHYEQLRVAYRDQGERGYWQKQRELGERDPTTSPYFLARFLAYLDVDEMFRRLEVAYTRRERETMEYLLFDECWDPYRADPRFKALLKRVGFEK